MKKLKNTEGKRKNGNPKRKVSVTTRESVIEKKTLELVPFHSFLDDEKEILRSSLLKWYDDNKRDLPWRLLNKVPDVNQRAYAVWVSEVMLQQTQVAVVIDYYKKWMKKWPTLQHLAKAKLEEVNEMWCGLGYYSRGRRLHEGAQKVVQELGGVMPSCAKDLQETLPGVGRYTACAISSIAFSQVTGVVDGNVLRVLSRLRLIGTDVTSQVVNEKIWELANSIVDTTRPGDFNQAIMELGATVCTPKTPQCSKCPLSHVCKAFAKTERDMKLAASHLFAKKDESLLLDIECAAENCEMCLPSAVTWDRSLGVMNLPRKAKKKEPREQTASVVVVCRICEDSQLQFLLLQRPQKGLLAGLWEFPNTIVDEDVSCMGAIGDQILELKSDHGVDITSPKRVIHLGKVEHKFSHIHQTYKVTLVTVMERNVSVSSERPARWLRETEITNAAVPTAMRKVYKLCISNLEGKTGIRTNKRKRELSGDTDKKQRSISVFFKPKLL